MPPSDPSRRAALAALASLCCSEAGAQSGAVRAARPTELIVPGSRDAPLGVSAAVLAEAMSLRWRHRVALQFASGAVSGALAVIKGSPDGNRIGLASPSLGINAALRPALPYSTLADLAPVCELATFEYGIFVNPALPVHTVAELIAHALDARTPMRYVSPGVGTGSHLAAESMGYEAGVKLEHVPVPTYDAAEKVVATGQVQVLFRGLAASVAETRKGPLRLIGLMGQRVVADAAGVSSVAQVLPGFEFTGTLGVIAPRTMQPATVRQLAQDISSLVTAPDTRQRLASLGLQAQASSPDEYEAHLRADIARWRLVGRITKVRLS
ncbi:hypothetical protein GT347_07150 [Xylophilus rhododendri]|uniref:Tripartite tricarboxylate transporter substrate binding protein n=1 Tax=Xylophilus rhododendri TaxID=2697032 RepID=A0A857J2C8_9BURK|nr:tripartite tricarboxylate transporter substrate-binding protein [Xylophilus rhododendri]QHI97787.1 hypothetical protein GT347_07150 [Xylophilus rhododendri]